MAIHKNYRKHFKKSVLRSLTGGGGSECLRASDLGENKLLPIDIPHHWYTVQYLQTMMSDDIYMRPLQRNLDDWPFFG